MSTRTSIQNDVLPVFDANHFITKNMAKFNFFSTVLLFLIFLNPKSITTQKYGESCGVGSSCDSTLSCLMGTCGCRNEGSRTFFDILSQSCLHPPEQACIQKPDFNEPRCISTSSCTLRSGVYVCVCNAGYITNTDTPKKCSHDYGYSPCRITNDHCDKTKLLKCNQEYTCDCREGATFNYIKQICQLLPGYECGPGVTEECISESSCTIDPSDGKSYCLCPPPSIPSSLNPTMCVLKYNQSCTATTALCDPTDALICDADLCKCEKEGTNSVWDKESQRCFLKAGADCKDTIIPCIQTGICNKEDVLHVCKCKDGLKANNEGFCHVQLGDKCQTNNDLCDPSKYLVCGQENICECKTSAIYNNITEVCELLPGSECEIGGIQLCYPTTVCEIDSESSMETCLCPAPSVISNDDQSLCVLHHNQSCSLTGAPCDPFSHLVCDNDLCKCKEENVGTIWDDKSRKCYVKIGFPCSETFADAQASCIPTANCVHEQGLSTCKCKSGLEPTGDNFCYINYQDTCFPDNDLCDPAKFLQCDLEFKCSCHAGSIYNEGMEICQLLPDSECGPNNPEECLAPTECKVDGFTRLSFCNCPVNSVPSRTDPHVCVINRGDLCSTSGLPCDASQHLECSGAVCLCSREGTESIYDDAAQRCVLKENALCDPTPDTNMMSCSSTAICTKKNGIPRCTCREGFIPNLNRMCYLEYTRECTPDNDLCDPLQFLYCDQEHKCGCRKGSVYDFDTKACSIIPGEICSPPGTGHNESCLLPSECVLDTIDRYHYCRCPMNSAPSEQDPTICVYSHNSSCNLSDVKCDPYSHLECVNNRCECFNEGTLSLWDPHSKSCLLIQGSPCNLYPKTDHPICHPTSICTTINGQSICVCRPGFVANSDHICMLNFQDKCRPENDFCDNLKFLECNQENICECKYGSVYDSSAGKCFRLPGQQCSFPISTGVESCLFPSLCQMEPLSISPNCVCPAPSVPSKDDPKLCVLKRNEKCIVAPEGLTCDPFAHLECHNASCQCIGETQTSFWKEDIKRCYLYPKEVCEPSTMPCATSSTCRMKDDQYICECRQGLEISKNRMCHLMHGQNCSPTNDLCDPTQFLSCDLENECSCGEKAKYLLDQATCLLLPDAPCSLLPDAQQCVPTSPCSKESLHCSCPIGSHRSIQDPTLCVIDIFQPCAVSEAICDPFEFLRCSHVSKECECDDENPQHTYLDWKAKKCYLKAGEFCSQQELSQECTPNSACLQIDKKYQCECRQGFLKNRFDQCYLPKGSPCRTENDLCDPDASLHCDAENVCSCRDGSIYMDEDCRLVENSTCHRPHMVYPNDYHYQPCIPNAICNDKDKCECVGDLKPNADRECYFPHDGICNPDEDLCDPKKQLECIHVDTEQHAKCVCKGELEGQSYYNWYAKTCYLLAGEKCVNEKSSMSCVPNSFCDPFEKICKCKFTLTKNLQGFCYLPYNSNCSLSNDLCDPATFLECYRETEKCVCQRNYETLYNEQEKNCFLIHDRPCRKGSEFQLCDPNASCEPYAPGNSTHRCRCKESYFPNSELICYKEYGQECSTSNVGECDPEGHLECRDGRCICTSEGMIFDADLKQCRAFVGMSCDAEGSAKSQKCVKGAHCNSHGHCVCDDDKESIFHRSKCLLKYGISCNSASLKMCNYESNLICSDECKCKKGYLEHETTIDGDQRVICMPGFNMTCEEVQHVQGINCNPDALLVCVNNRCLCPSNVDQAFIESEKQCRVTVGKKCDNEERICVPMGICNSSTCACAENFTTMLFEPRFCFPSTSHGLKRIWVLCLSTLGILKAFS